MSNNIVSIIIISFTECLTVVILTLICNNRLSNLVNQSSLTESLHSRMQFYITANYVQTFLVLLEFLSLGSINIDILSKSLLIAKSPFTTDMLTKLFSLAICFTNIPMILNIFPPQSLITYGTSTKFGNTTKSGGFSHGAPLKSPRTTTHFNKSTTNNIVVQA